MPRLPRSEISIRSVAFVSLGCPKNLVDSERMLGLLAADGLTVTSDASKADAIVINTCGFLEASKVESLQAIREAVAQKTDGKCQRVVVAGCLVQRHKTRLLSEVPDIDRLVGVFDREHIVQAVRGEANAKQDHGHYLGKYHALRETLDSQTLDGQTRAFEDDRARLRLTPRHWAYLRISEGCNQGCAFCTIPSIRGPMRSKPIEQILAEARELAADGAVELNLIGQDTTSFGADIAYEPGLAGMLRALDKQLTDVHWLRLMYAYPSCFTDDMIRAIADAGRVVKYIDMPLQHISDPLLTLMKRRVTRKQIETLLEKLRKMIPGIAIRTTFIAGSPGETDAQHDELVQFVKDFRFDAMGVFPYSPEPGTPMGRLENQLPESVRHQRAEELMLAQQEIAFATAAAQTGQTVEVLIDKPAGRDEPGVFAARTQSQAPDIDSMTFVRGKGLFPGQLLSVKITGSRGYDLLAEVPRKTARPLEVLRA
jgi:ribosomal protein S12 methylthiotransferase